MKPSELYILKQPDFYKEILLHVVSIIESEMPAATLLFKWGIPYFYYKGKPFCYLAPNHKRKFVDVGFARGFQLKKNQDILVDEKRNTVKSLRYFALQEINYDQMISVIKEAKELY